MEKDIKQLLNNNVVEFTFTKKNGEIRKAVGSRNINFLIWTDQTNFTENDKPKGINKESDSVCPYWDFDKCAWRSVAVDSVISIDKLYEIDAFWTNEKINTNNN